MFILCISTFSIHLLGNFGCRIGTCKGKTVEKESEDKVICEGKGMLDTFQSSFNNETSRENHLIGLEKMHKNEDLFKVLEVLQDY